MYERFHNLRERPFSLTPDPDYLYPSRVHREALSYLRYGIEGRAGFIVITGEIGSGKTTLLQTTLRSLDHQTSVARLVNTMLDSRELLEAMLLDFGIDPGHGRSKPHLLRDLASYLVAQRSAGRLALLVIDEAQNLSFSALEEIRMLSNLETEKSKLIQIALVGQPSLRDLLARPELEQLRQRVTVSYHLQALDAAETAAYINHRLRRAAIGAPLEFNRDVTDLIHGYSMGVPRKINVIADAVLLFAYGEEQHTITRSLTYEVLDELEGTGVLPPSTARLDPGAAAKVPGTTAAPGTPDDRDHSLRATAAETDAALPSRAAAESHDYPLRPAPTAADDRPSAVRYAPQPPTSTVFPAQPAVPTTAAATAPLTAPKLTIDATPLRPPAVAEPLPPPSVTPAMRPAGPTTSARQASLPSSVRPPSVGLWARPGSVAAPPRPASVVAPARAIVPTASAGVAEPQGLWERLRRGLSLFAKPAFED
jgi:putative secretion ATPase (PEP-CTERM system associated)